MLRFGSTSSRQNSRPSNKIGWRIWVIVGLMAVVIGAIQSLKQPATVAQLDALFQTKPDEEDLQSAQSELPEGRQFLEVKTTLDNSAPSDLGEASTNVDLSQVKDNTYFRPQENEAWFAILEGLRDKDSEQIRSDSVGEVTYAQLLAQPDVYRGKVVTVRGRVLREESLDAPSNNVGITSYHRLVLRPSGGGVWPIIVYCLKLPENFSHGDKLSVEVAVDGVFFKNWSYAWNEGLGLAPVILAKNISLHPSSPTVEAAKNHGTETTKTPSKSSEKLAGGFRDVLELLDLGPEILESLFEGQALTVEDWKILSQLLARLQAYDATELARWILPTTNLSTDSVGELFAISGTAFECESIEVPPEFVPLLGITEVYRCRIRLDEARTGILFTSEIPERWKGDTKLNEPVRSRAILLRDNGDTLLMVTNHLNWFPEAGVPSGQLLFSQHGMDVALWDAIKQRGKFITPETSQEAKAFFAGLAALEKIPAEMLSEQVTEHLALLAESEPANLDGTTDRIAATVAEQAQGGLSSVVPMFLSPDKQVGELVRLEGVARRAVKILEEEGSVNQDQSERFDYYELEIFTLDSQNLPVIVCVSQLPEGFPLGDKIREQVRLEGIFFKSWQYRSRKLVDASGETTRQQQRYTPIVLARTVSWIQQAPGQQGWWGLAAGVGFLTLLTLAWVWFAFNWRNDRRPRPTDDAIDLSNL